MGWHAWICCLGVTGGGLLLLGSGSPGQNLFVSQRSSFQNAIARIQEMKTIMKRMIQFLLNCTFFRYFDSEFLQGKKKKKNSAASSVWWQIPYLPLSGQILGSRFLHICFVLREPSIGAHYSLCCSVCSLCQGKSGGKTGQHEKWERKFLKAV